MGEKEALEIAVNALRCAKEAVEKRIEALEAERDVLRSRLFAYEICLIQLENQKIKGEW